jgi:hypothetical protein
VTGAVSETEAEARDEDGTGAETGLGATYFVFTLFDICFLFADLMGVGGGGEDLFVGDNIFLSRSLSLCLRIGALLDIILIYSLDFFC